MVRDRAHRILSCQYEVERQALLTILNGKVEGITNSHRIRAMLELNRLPKHSDNDKLIDRCVESGKYRVRCK